MTYKLPNKNPVPPGYSTTLALAKMVGVTTRTIERWYVQGVIPEPAKRTPNGADGRPGWKMWSPEQNRLILAIAQERKKDGRANRAVKDRQSGSGS